MVSLFSKKRTAINIASQWGTQIANIVITFALIGYSVNLLGAEHYGGWAAIISIIGYLTMLDSGMSVAVQYYVSRFSTANNKNDLSVFYSTTFVLYGVTAVIAGLICFWLSVIPTIIFSNVSPEIVEENVAALKWVGAGMFLFMLSMPSQGALMGLQRYYIKNVIEVISIFSRFVTVVILFELVTPSVEYLGLAFFVDSLIRLILCQLLVRKVDSNLKVNLKLVNRSSFKDVFSFGGHSTFWSVATAITRESGPFIALILVGAKESTYVYVGIRLVRSVGVFIQSTGQVFLPIATSLHQAADKPGLQMIVLRGTQFCGLMSFSGAAILVIFGEKILWYWLGDSGVGAYGVVVVTTIGMLAVWTSQVPLSVVMGMKVLWPITLMMLFRLLTSIVLALILGNYYGSTGVAAGMIIPVALSSMTIVPWLAISLVELKIINLAIMLIRPALIGIVIGSIGYLLYYLWSPTDILILIIELLIMFILFVGLAIGWGVDQESRQLILRKIRLFNNQK